jgi:CelD/BcsL family acetyltransferase involved in cellulose biosynthesis
MQIHVIPGQRLSAEHAACWSALQQADPALRSPFFRPEYTQTVAAFCPGVEVAILEDQGRAVGFFPYQRLRRRVAGPVGGALCDFQGLVLQPEIAVNAEQLLRGCRLTTWHFDHLIVSQKVFRAQHAVVADSTYVDLCGGFEAYKAVQRQRGSQAIPKTQQKARKAGREVGPLRFELRTTDRRVLETLIAWKVQQYQQLRDVNYLAPDWTRSMLAAITEMPDPAFGGMLSALYFGDRLAAAHLGIRSHGVLHAWFPCYDADLAAYSPGLILWIELMQACAAAGVVRIDFGKGDQRFKTSFMSGAESVAEGSIDLRRWSGAFKRTWLHTRDWIRSTPLRAPARVPARMLRRIQAWLEQRGGGHRLRHSGSRADP